MMLDGNQSRELFGYFLLVVVDEMSMT